MMDTTNLSPFVTSSGSGGSSGGDSGGGWEWDDPSNTSAPSWMSSGAYAKWWQGSDPEWAASDPSVKQRWWRDPSTPGGIVWHPYWGWQSRSAVKDMYKSDQDNSVSWDEFQGWGFTPQLGSYQDYYPQGVGNDGDAGGGDYWAGDLSLGSPGYTWGGTSGTTGTTGGGTMGNTTGTSTDPTNNWNSSFQNYPYQWGQSQNVVDYLGSNTPWQYDAASQTAYDMSQTGMPTNVDPWYQAAQQRGWYDTKDAIAQAAEQAGLGGTRWSSQMGRTAQDIAGRRAADLAEAYAQQTMGAQEAARGRQLQGASQLQGLGTDVNNQLFNVASQYSNLGSKYAQYPMDLAGAAYGMGTQNQAATQSALDKYYNEFLRTAAENNPYLAMIYQMATGQGTPQTYNPGQETNLLGILGQIFGY